MRIFKYQLKFPADEQKIEMPANAGIISCQVQEGAITLWAIVDPDAKPVERFFTVLGTGHAFFEGSNRQLHHLGTVQLDGFVWHVFEEVA